MFRLRGRVPAVVAVTVLLSASGCSRSDEIRAEPEGPGSEEASDPKGSPVEIAAVVGEPLSPRLRSQQVWTGSELLSFGGTSVDSEATTSEVVSLDVDSLVVTRVFDPPPFDASFNGGAVWVGDRVYFSGVECRDDEKPSGVYPEFLECPRVPVLVTLDPDSGDWETLELPPGTEEEEWVNIFGEVPGVGVVATAGFDPTRLWARTAEGDWTELPEPALQAARPGEYEPPLGYDVKAVCLIGDALVQLGAERLEGTSSRDITTAVLDLGEGSEWRTSVRPELDTDGAPNIFCGDDAVVFSPLTGPSGPISTFSPDDESWTSIGPSTVQLEGVEPPYGILGLPGFTGREVVYPGAPGVGSQILGISTRDWRAGPPAPAMFDDYPTWIGDRFVGVSATGTASEFTTPEPMDLPPTGTLFTFNVE